MARLTLTLLGGFRAHLDPGAPLAFPTRKAQALLAYLAMPPGVAHPRDKLASLLWGNNDRDDGAHEPPPDALLAAEGSAGRPG